MDDFTTERYTVRVFFDVLKTVDRIPNLTIPKALANLNLKGNLPSFTFFLRYRSFKIRMGADYSDSKIK